MNDKRWCSNKNTFDTVQTVTLASQWLVLGCLFFFHLWGISLFVQDVQNEAGTKSSLFCKARIYDWITFKKLKKNWWFCNGRCCRSEKQFLKELQSYLGTFEACYNFRSRNHCKGASVLIFKMFTLYTWSSFCCKTSFYKSKTPLTVWEN